MKKAQWGEGSRSGVLILVEEVCVLKEGGRERDAKKKKKKKNAHALLELVQNRRIKLDRLLKLIHNFKMTQTSDIINLSSSDEEQQGINE